MSYTEEEVKFVRERYILVEAIVTVIPAGSRNSCCRSIIN